MFVYSIMAYNVRYHLYDSLKSVTPLFPPLVTPVLSGWFLWFPVQLKIRFRIFITQCPTTYSSTSPSYESRLPYRTRLHVSALTLIHANSLVFVFINSQWLYSSPWSSTASSSVDPLVLAQNIRCNVPRPRKRSHLLLDHFLPSIYESERKI